MQNLNSSIHLNRQDVLALVQEKTGYPESWLQRREIETLRALDSTGALSFLDGLKGTIQDENSEEPEWLFDLVSRGEKYARVQIKGVECETYTYVQKYNWAEGIITLCTRLQTAVETFSEEDCKVLSEKVQQQKLGKWLKKNGATPEQMKEFETRVLVSWEFRLSSSPWDILTMSHNRPWTSCMRPRGAYKDGPLSVSQAGGCMVWWHRPGAEQPCGRQYLLPVVVGEEARIYMSPDVYGSGPLVRPEAFQEVIEGLLGYEMPKISLMNLDGEVDNDYWEENWYDPKVLPLVSIVYGIYDDAMGREAYCMLPSWEAADCITEAFATYLLKSKEDKSLQELRNRVGKLLAEDPAPAEKKSPAKGKVTNAEEARKVNKAFIRLYKAFNRFFWNQTEENALSILEKVIDLFDLRDSLKSSLKEDSRFFSLPGEFLSCGEAFEIWAARTKLWNNPSRRLHLLAAAATLDSFLE